VSALSGTSLANTNVLTVAASNATITSVDAALQQIDATGAQLGAYQARFQAAVTGLQTASTNLSSARSSIEDTDYAAATSQLTQAQILQQAGTAMVAQANEIPQNVLTLLSKLS
jgi:flagellin